MHQAVHATLAADNCLHDLLTDIHLHCAEAEVNLTEIGCLRQNLRISSTNGRNAGISFLYHSWALALNFFFSI